MRIRLKNVGQRCRLTGLRAEILFGFLVFKEALAERGVRTVRLTSGTDSIGAHGFKSKHMIGQALDIDADQIDPLMLPGLLEEVRESLGPDYDIIEEGAGTVHHHIHIEFDPERD